MSKANTTYLALAAIGLVVLASARLPAQNIIVLEPTTLSPSYLNFGNIPMGQTSPPQIVTLTNGSSTATLIISAVNIGADFQQNNNCGGSVAPKSACTFNVAFFPQTANGSLNESLSVNFVSGTAAVALSGSSIGFTLAPVSLAFGVQTVGTTSAAQTVTLTNGTFITLAIASVTIGPDFAESNTCGSSVAIGATCTFSVTFVPTADAADNETLTVATGAGTSTVALTGTGDALTLLPASLSFVNTAVGATSASQTVTLTNGASTLTISSVTIGPDFTESNSCGSSLAAMGACTFTVSFAPQTSGVHNETLSVTDSGPGSPQTVTLTGTGTGPGLSLNPSSLSFPNQAVGTTSTAQTVTFTNGSASTLTISSVTVGPDFAQTNTCGSSLAAGSNCTFSVTFVPTSAATFNESLTITDNGAGSPQTVPLSGTGYSNLALDPGFELQTGAQNAALVSPWVGEGPGNTYDDLTNPHAGTHDGAMSTGGTANLVSDPGFELQSGGSGAPLVSPWSAEGPASVVVDTALPHTGSKDVHVSSTGAAAWTAAIQTVTVTANTMYVLTGWGQSGSSAGNFTGSAFGVRTGAFGSTIIASTPIVDNGSYTQLTVVFNSGSNTSLVVFAGFAPSGPAGFHFDDLTLTGVTNITQAISAVAANTNYTLSGYFALPSGSISSAELGVRTSSGATLIAETPIGSGSSYAQVSLYFNTGASTAVTIFAGGVLGAGAVLDLDDFSLLPGGSPPAVTVTSVSPNTGTCLGGTPITVSGTTFKSGAVVNFSSGSFSANATGVTVANSNTITAVTPSGHLLNPPCTN